MFATSALHDALSNSAWRSWKEQQAWKHQASVIPARKDPVVAGLLPAREQPARRDQALGVPLPQPGAAEMPLAVAPPPGLEKSGDGWANQWAWTAFRQGQAKEVQGGADTPESESAYLFRLQPRAQRAS